MSLSTVIQNVANEAGYTVSPNIVTATDTTTKQLLAIAQRINREMFEQYPWTKCYASGSITLVAGQAQYALPAAFSYYQYDTFWNQSNRWRVLGPMTPQEYADIRGFGLNPTIYQQFQIRGISNDQLLIYPTPDANPATIQKPAKGEVARVSAGMYMNDKGQIKKARDVSTALRKHYNLSKTKNEEL